MDYPLIRKMKDQIIELKATKKIKLNDLEKEKARLSELQIEQDHCLQARALVQKVAEETQQKIEYHISNLVSMALASVFPDPYEFRVRFIQRRNRTECDLLFVKNGEECDPLTAAGGGAVDVAGFALRIAVWSLKKTRNVFILDEPFRFLSVDLQAKCSAMIKEISEKLKIQIILISHLPNIIESADRIFKIENVKGESKVSIVQ